MKRESWVVAAENRHFNAVLTLFSSGNQSSNFQIKRSILQHGFPSKDKLLYLADEHLI